MNFQTHCDRYLQKIRHTQESAAATPELSLFPHLQVFLEELSVDHFRRNTIRFVQEPRRLDQIGRPDFVAMDGLLPIGYIEAEAYGRDLNNLTGHAQEQTRALLRTLITLSSRILSISSYGQRVGGVQRHALGMALKI